MKNTDSKEILSASLESTSEDILELAQIIEAIGLLAPNLSLAERDADDCH